ncbi:OmpA/MotB family protein [Desulfobacterium sp. N47]|uniref:OmpA/MotB family protein n=1 Tax=Desulfobacterium sp. N47 TaxID=3115210 RepID=UPI003C9D7411
MNRKKKNNGQDLVRDIGATITVSLFMIILTFFILLNSMAIIDQNRKRTAIKSLAESFGSLTDKAASSAHPEVDKGKILEKALGGINENANDDIGIKTGAGREVLTMGEKALFYTNRHLLKPESFALLKKVGNFINQGNYKVLIVGHTDNRDAQEKGYNSNWEISSLMAVQLQKYFIEECKIKPDRITAYGYGSQQPAASNDTPESRQKNRRIEIIFNSDSPVKKVYSESPSGNFTYRRFNFNAY